MQYYQFSAVKFVPDLVRYEPINIGVLLKDGKTGILYGKFVKDARFLGKRHPKSDVRLVQKMIDKYSRPHKSALSLARISQSSVYNLQFTAPSAAGGDAPQDALEELFEDYVGVRRPSRAKAPTRRAIVGSIHRQIKRLEIDKKCVLVNRPIRIRDRLLVADFAFGNGRLVDLIDVMPPVNSAGYRRAIALSALFKRAASVHKGLRCTVFLAEPAAKSIYHDAAAKSLADSRCTVVGPDQVRLIMAQIKRRLLQA